MIDEEHVAKMKVADDTKEAVASRVEAARLRIATSDRKFKAYAKGPHA